MKLENEDQNKTGKKIYFKREPYKVSSQATVHEK